MANALARTVDIQGSGDGAMLRLAVVFSGSDVGSPFTAEIEVPLTGTEQPAAIRSAMSAAVSAWPAANGYAFTVLGGSMTLPTFQKG